MTKFQTITLDTLPKREPRGFDADAANALLAAVQAAPDSGATDGIEYSDEAGARKVAAKHKRLLAHVAGSKIARSRVFATGKGFGWAVLLADKPAEAKKSGK